MKDLVTIFQSPIERLRVARWLAGSKHRPGLDIERNDARVDIHGGTGTGPKVVCVSVAIAHLVNKPTGMRGLRRPVLAFGSLVSHDFGQMPEQCVEIEIVFGGA